MAHLYFIRHARTQPDPDLPADQWHLSEEGVVAAAALAGKPFWTTIQHIFVSDELKTYATIAPTLELWGLRFDAYGEFDEVRRGGFMTTQEAYEEQVRHFFANPAAAPEGWENAAAALERGQAGLERALAAYPDQNLAFIGHGLMWSLLRAHLLGKAAVDPAEWKAVAFPDVMVWRVEGGEWQLLQDFEGIRQLAY